ncbi:hypothetical protein AB0941_27945 [Streptomyces sp. NPDC013433]|uniref:hypothetical protein n=1 Tax=Streptomyces sp. NPDC013433 TaxID=3155604 RepID=UPI003455CEB2
MEALLAAPARAEPALLTVEAARALGVDPAAPVPPDAGALRVWAGGVIADADVPAGAEPLPDGHPVTLDELRAAGVPFDGSVVVQAALTGGSVAVGTDVPLTTAQRYWLRLHRQDGPAGETVADLVGRLLGCRVVLAGPGGSGPRALGSASGPTVLPTPAGDRWRAVVVRNVEAVATSPFPAPGPRAASGPPPALTETPHARRDPVPGPRRDSGARHDPVPGPRPDGGPRAMTPLRWCFPGAEHTPGKHHRSSEPIRFRRRRRDGRYS